MLPNNFKPVNLGLVKITQEESKSLSKVKTGEIFNTNNMFHPEGLFSVETFGGVGSELRNSKFGIVDLGLDILHPLVYRSICAVKSLYGQIIENKVTAIFNKKTGMFEKSSEPDARSGMSFFLEHVNELKFESSKSDERNFQIKLIQDAIREDKLTAQYLLVIPAGMRDYVIDENGRPQEDEVNPFYRKLIAGAGLVDPAVYRKAPEYYDVIAGHQQKASLALYEYFESILEGKNKFILGKWMSRKIFNTTRNVFTSYINKHPNGKDPRRLGYNDVMLGIHQFARSLSPKTIYELKNGYIRDIFVENSNTAYLVNAKTLKREELSSSYIQKEYDKWTSVEGLERVIASLGNLDLREHPITLNRGKHYLGLLYRDDKVFKFFNDIDELPEGFSKDKVKPITLIEFIYISLHKLDGKYGGYITRYPIQGYGGIYPANIRVTTTNDTDILKELDHEWQVTETTAINFPVLGSGPFNSMAIHQSHLAALGGDHDGDMGNLTPVMTDEANEEIQKKLHSKEYYVSDTGSFVFSSDNDVLSAVLGYLT